MEHACTCPRVCVPVIAQLLVFSVIKCLIVMGYRAVAY